MTNVRERLAKALDNYEEERKDSRQVVMRLVSMIGICLSTL